MKQWTAFSLPHILKRQSNKHEFQHFRTGQRNQWLIVLKKNDPYFDPKLKKAWTCQLWRPRTPHFVAHCESHLSGTLHIAKEGERTCWRHCGCGSAIEIKYGPGMFEEVNTLYKLLPSQLCFYEAHDFEEQLARCELHELVHLFQLAGAQTVTARVLQGNAKSLQVALGATAQVSVLGAKSDYSETSNETYAAAYAISYGPPSKARARCSADLLAREGVYYLHLNPVWKDTFDAVVGVNEFDFTYQQTVNLVARSNMEMALEVPGMATAGGKWSKDRLSSNSLHISFHVTFYPWEQTLGSTAPMQLTLANVQLKQPLAVEPLKQLLGTNQHPDPHKQLSDPPKQLSDPRKQGTDPPKQHADLPKQHADPLKQHADLPKQALASEPAKQHANPVLPPRPAAGARTIHEDSCEQLRC